MKPAEPAAAPWNEQQERGSLRALRMMGCVATLFGRRITRLVLHPIALYFLLFGGAAPKESKRYLSRVLQRPPTWVERYRHLHRFTATVLDRVYLLQERFEDFDIEVQGLEHLEAVLAQGRGALLMGAHVGSFEVMRCLGQAKKGLEVAMVMYEDNARKINDTLKAVAPAATLHTIALGRLESMLQLREWLDNGGVAGLLADRTLPAQSQRSALHPLDFLGATAAFSDGPFRLAAMLRRPVLFMAGLYLGGNRYQLRFSPIADFSERHATRESADAAVMTALAHYVATVEKTCREHPFNWFNFFDFWAPANARHIAR